MSQPLRDAGSDGRTRRTGSGRRLAFASGIENVPLELDVQVEVEANPLRPRFLPRATFADSNFSNNPSVGFEPRDGVRLLGHLSFPPKRTTRRQNMSGKGSSGRSSGWARVVTACISSSSNRLCAVAEPLIAQCRGTPLTASLQRVEIDRDVARLPTRQSHIGHSIAGHDALRPLLPCHHVLEGVAADGTHEIREGDSALGPVHIPARLRHRLRGLSRSMSPHVRRRSSAT